MYVLTDLSASHKITQTSSESRLHIPTFPDAESRLYLVFEDFENTMIPFDHKPYLGLKVSGEMGSRK